MGVCGDFVRKGFLSASVLWTTFNETTTLV